MLCALPIKCSPHHFFPTERERERARDEGDAYIIRALHFSPFLELPVFRCILMTGSRETDDSEDKGYFETGEKKDSDD